MELRAPVTLLVPQRDGTESLLVLLPRILLQRLEEKPYGFVSDATDTGHFLMLFVGGLDQIDEADEIERYLRRELCRTAGGRLRAVLRISITAECRAEIYCSGRVFYRLGPEILHPDDKLRALELVYGDTVREALAPLKPPESFIRRAEQEVAAN